VRPLGKKKNVPTQIWNVRRLKRSESPSETPKTPQLDFLKGLPNGAFEDQRKEGGLCRKDPGVFKVYSSPLGYQSVSKRGYSMEKKIPNGPKNSAPLI